MNFTAENPKATITAATGLVVMGLKMFVFKDSFSPEIESWLNVLLPTVFLFLMGRFTRISKSQATVLKMPKVKSEVAKDEVLEERNQLS